MGSGARAKRARTGLADPPPPPPLPVSSPLRLDRDWANLDAGPTGLVAERVLRHDVVDFVRFRAVCRAWRACSAHVRAHGVLDRRFHPRQWILLPKAFDVGERRRFMHVLTGECIYLRLNLRRYSVPGTTSEGLILQVPSGNRAAPVRLLNPLTGQMAVLPSAKSLLRPIESLNSLDLRGAGVADDSTVVLHFRSFSLAVAKPGDERWTHIQSRERITSVLPFAGRIYCATVMDVSFVDTAAASQPPQLVVAAIHKIHTKFPSVEDFKCDVYQGRSRIFLVENHGELMLCYRARPEPHHQRKGDCSVYRVNLDTRNTASLHGLDGQALFVGSRRSLMVAAGVSPSINADTAYLCYRNRMPKHDAGYYVAAFDLLDGCTEPKFKEDDAAYCLAGYVSAHLYE